jgi:hypothetical protein
VVALHLRSNAKLDAPELAQEQEMDYPAIINKALPDDIRVLGWATAAPDFSARCGRAGALAAPCPAARAANARARTRGRGRRPLWGVLLQRPPLRRAGSAACGGSTSTSSCRTAVWTWG